MMLMSAGVAVLLSSVLGSLFLFVKCETDPYASSSIKLSTQTLTIQMDAEKMYTAERLAGGDFNFPVSTVTVQLNKMPSGAGNRVYIQSQNPEIAIPMQDSILTRDGKGSFQVQARNGGVAEFRIMAGGGGVEARLKVIVSVPSKDFRIRDGKTFAVMKNFKSGIAPNESGTDAVLDFEEGDFDFFSISREVSPTAWRSFTATERNIDFEIEKTQVGAQYFSIRNNRLTISWKLPESKPSVKINAFLRGTDKKEEFTVYIIEPMGEVKLNGQGGVKTVALVANHENNDAKGYKSEVEYKVSLENYASDSYGFYVINDYTKYYSRVTNRFERYIEVDQMDLKQFRLSAHGATEGSAQPYVDVIVYPIIDPDGKPNTGDEIHLTGSAYSKVQAMPKRINVLAYNVFKNGTDSTKGVYPDYDPYNALTANGSKEPLGLYYTNTNDLARAVSFNVKHINGHEQFIHNNKEYFETNANIYFEIEYTGKLGKTGETKTDWTKYPKRIVTNGEPNDKDFAMHMWYGRSPVQIGQIAPEESSDFRGMEYGIEFAMLLNDKDLLECEKVRLVVRSVDQFRNKWAENLKFAVGYIDLTLVRDIKEIKAYGEDKTPTNILYPILPSEGVDLNESYYDFYLEGIKISDDIGELNAREARDGYRYRYVNSAHSSYFDIKPLGTDGNRAKFRIVVEPDALNMISSLETYRVRFTYLTGKWIDLQILPVQTVSNVADMFPRRVGEGRIFDEGTRHKPGDVPSDTTYYNNKILTRVVLQIDGSYSLGVVGALDIDGTITPSNTAVWGVFSSTDTTGWFSPFGPDRGTLTPIKEGIYGAGIQFKSYNPRAIVGDLRTRSYPLEVVVVNTITHVEFKNGKTESTLYSRRTLFYDGAVKPENEPEKSLDTIEIVVHYVNETEGANHPIAGWAGTINAPAGTVNYSVNQLAYNKFQLQGLRKADDAQTLFFVVTQSITYPNGTFILQTPSFTNVSNPMKYYVRVEDATPVQTLNLYDVTPVPDENKMNSGYSSLLMEIPTNALFERTADYALHDLHPTPNALAAQVGGYRWRDDRYGMKFEIRDRDTNVVLKTIGSTRSDKTQSITVYEKDLISTGDATRKIISVNQKGVLMAYNQSATYEKISITLVIYPLDTIHLNLDGKQPDSVVGPAGTSIKTVTITIVDPSSGVFAIRTKKQFLEYFYTSRGTNYYEGKNFEAETPIARTGRYFLWTDITFIGERLTPIRNFQGELDGAQAFMTANGASSVSSVFTNYEVGATLGLTSGDTTYFGMFYNLGGKVKNIKFNNTAMAFNFTSSQTKNCIGVVASLVASGGLISDVWVDLAGTFVGDTDANINVNFGAIAGENGGKVTENKGMHIGGKVTFSAIKGYNIGGVVGLNNFEVGNEFKDKIKMEDIVISTELSIVVLKTVDAVGNLGGVCGQNKLGGKVQNLSSESVIVNQNGGTTGGVVGLSAGTVQNCYNSGVMIAIGTIGGVVGQSSGFVYNSYFDLLISEKVLSILADTTSGDKAIQSLWPLASASTSRLYGGILIPAGTAQVIVGGVVGENKGGTISHSYATSAFFTYSSDNETAKIPTISKTDLRGMVYGGEIAVLGDITGRCLLGGIVGKTTGGFVKKSLAEINILKHSASTVDIGGLAAFSDTTVPNPTQFMDSYWNALDITAGGSGQPLVNDHAIFNISNFDSTGKWHMSMAKRADLVTEDEITTDEYPYWYKRNITKPTKIEFVFRDEDGYRAIYGQNENALGGISFVVPADNGTNNVALFYTHGAYEIPTKYYLDDIFKAIPIVNDVDYAPKHEEISLFPLVDVTPDDASTRVTYKIEKETSKIPFGIDTNTKNGKARYYIQVQKQAQFDLVVTSVREIPGGNGVVEPVFGRVHFDVIPGIKSQSASTTLYGEVGYITLSAQDRHASIQDSFMITKTKTFSVNASVGNANWKINETRHTKRGGVEVSQPWNFPSNLTTYLVGDEYVRYEFTPQYVIDSRVYSCRALTLDKVKACYYKGATELTVQQNKTQIDPSSSVVFSGTMTTGVDNVQWINIGGQTINKTKFPSFQTSARFIDLAEFRFSYKTHDGKEGIVDNIFHSNYGTQGNPSSVIGLEYPQSQATFDDWVKKGITAQRVYSDDKLPWNLTFDLRAEADESNFNAAGKFILNPITNDIKYHFDVRLRVSPKDKLYDIIPDSGAQNGLTIADKSFDKVLNGTLSVQESLTDGHVGESSMTRNNYVRMSGAEDCKIVPQEVQSVSFKHFADTSLDNEKRLILDTTEQTRNPNVYADTINNSWSGACSPGILVVDVNPYFASIQDVTISSTPERRGTGEYNILFQQLVLDKTFVSPNGGTWRFHRVNNSSTYLPISSISDSTYEWDGTMYFATVLNSTGRVFSDNVTKPASFTINVAVKGLNVEKTLESPDTTPVYEYISNDTRPEFAEYLDKRVDSLSLGVSTREAILFNYNNGKQMQRIVNATQAFGTTKPFSFTQTDNVSAKKNDPDAREYNFYPPEANVAIELSYLNNGSQVFVKYKNGDPIDDFLRTLIRDDKNNILPSNTKLKAGTTYNLNLRQGLGVQYGFNTDINTGGYDDKNWNNQISEMISNGFQITFTMNYWAFDGRASSFRKSQLVIGIAAFKIDKLKVLVHGESLADGAPIEVQKESPQEISFGLVLEKGPDITEPYILANLDKLEEKAALKVNTVEASKWFGYSGRDKNKGNGESIKQEYDGKTFKQNDGLAFYLGYNRGNSMHYLMTNSLANNTRGSIEIIIEYGINEKFEIDFSPKYAKDIMSREININVVSNTTIIDPYPWKVQTFIQNANGTTERPNEADKVELAQAQIPSMFNVPGAVDYTYFNSGLDSLELVKIEKVPNGEKAQEIIKAGGVTWVYLNEQKEGTLNLYYKRIPSLNANKVNVTFKTRILDSQNNLPGPALSDLSLRFNKQYTESNDPTSVLLSSFHNQLGYEFKHITVNGKRKSTGQDLVTFRFSLNNDAVKNAQGKLECEIIVYYSYISHGLTEADPLFIVNEAGFSDMQPDLYYILMDDIVLSSKYVPTSFRARMLDGNNKRIITANLKNVTSDMQNFGVFTEIEKDCVIKNLGIVLPKKSDKSSIDLRGTGVTQLNLGALAGKNNGIITNVVVTSDAGYEKQTGTYTLGKDKAEYFYFNSMPDKQRAGENAWRTGSGVTANHYAEKTTFGDKQEDQNNRGILRAIVDKSTEALKIQMGGLVAQNAGVISNCRVYVDVELATEYKSSGSKDASISDSVIGGFVGTNDKGTIVSSAFKYGNVLSNGELLGGLDVQSSRTGGFVGINTNGGLIKGCLVNTIVKGFNNLTGEHEADAVYGKIDSKHTHVAGFVCENNGKSNSQISDCYVETFVAGGYTRSGFIWKNLSGGIIKNCFINNPKINDTSYHPYYDKPQSDQANISNNRITSNGMVEEFNVYDKQKNIEIVMAYLPRGGGDDVCDINQFTGFSISDKNAPLKGKNNIWEMTDIGARLVSAEEITASVSIPDFTVEAYAFGRKTELAGDGFEYAGKKTNPYLIYDAVQLNQLLSQRASISTKELSPTGRDYSDAYFSANIRLVNNISFENVTNDLIDSYKITYWGTNTNEKNVFDGNGLNITHIAFAATETIRASKNLDSIGFFSQSNNVVFKNLNMSFRPNKTSDADFSINAAGEAGGLGGATYVGGLVGKAITTDFVDINMNEIGQGGSGKNWRGHIYGTNIVGGMVGLADECRMENVEINLSVMSEKGRAQNRIEEGIIFIGNNNTQLKDFDDYEEVFLREVQYEDGIKSGVYKSDGTPHDEKTVGGHINASVAGGVAGMVRGSKTDTHNVKIASTATRTLSAEVVGGVFGYVAGPQTECKSVFVDEDELETIDKVMVIDGKENSFAAVTNIRNASATTTLKSRFFAGGLVGINSGTIDNSEYNRRIRLITPTNDKTRLENEPAIGSYAVRVITKPQIGDSIDNYGDLTAQKLGIELHNSQAVVSNVNDWVSTVRRSDYQFGNRTDYYAGVSVGGVAGYNKNKIKGMNVGADINLPNAYSVGGIAGLNSNYDEADEKRTPMITGCSLRDVKLNAGLYVGGIIGKVDNGTISTISGKYNSAKTAQNVSTITWDFEHANAQLVVEETKTAQQFKPSSPGAQTYAYLHSYKTSFDNPKTGDGWNTIADTIKIFTSSANTANAIFNPNNHVMINEENEFEKWKTTPQFQYRNNIIGNVYVDLSSLDKTQFNFFTNLSPAVKDKVVFASNRTATNTAPIWAHPTFLSAPNLGILLSLNYYPGSSSATYLTVTGDINTQINSTSNPNNKWLPMTSTQAKWTWTDSYGTPLPTSELSKPFPSATTYAIFTQTVGDEAFIFRVKVN